ncbi:MAG: hypothetical protein WKF60_10105 [Ilumatobacter sp.]
MTLSTGLQLMPSTSTGRITGGNGGSAARGMRSPAWLRCKPFVQRMSVVVEAVPREGFRS